MPEIRVTSSMLQEKSGTIKMIASKMQQIEADIRSEIDRIKPAWEGEAATASYERYVKIGEELKGIYTTIESYSQFLDKSAAQFAEAESKSTSAIRSGG